MTTLLIVALALLAVLLLALTAGRALAQHLYEMADEDLILNNQLAIDDGAPDNMYIREINRRTTAEQSAI